VTAETPARPVASTLVAVTGIRTAKDFRDAADTLRTRVDGFGKVLVGIATLGTGSVGLAKIGDLFPVPEKSEPWALAAVAGLAGSAIAAVIIAIRLMRVGEPAVIEVDVDESSPGIKKSDMPNIRRIFSASASRFGFVTLDGLQERERTLRRAANRAGEASERARRTALADELRTEIETALARAQLAVVRRRSTDAVGTLTAFVLYTVVLGGLLLFAAGADKVASERVEVGKDALACAEAREAGATDDELTDSGCKPDDEETDPLDEAPTVQDQRNAFLEELATPLSTCLKLSTTPTDAVDREDEEDGAGPAVTRAECARLAELVATFTAP
jgi:hypothetical protein